MSAISTLLTGVSDVLPQIVTGGCTLGAVWLTYRFGERQRARERASTTNKKVEELAQELFEAVGALHLALKMYVPVHNAWRPKLMSLGAAFLEYLAAKSTGNHALGMAQVGRFAVEANQQDLNAAMGLQAPMQRLLAVAGRAATLADGEVREAALKLGQVAAESGQAYGQDNLWRSKRARAARERADVELYATLDELLTAVRAHLHPAGTPRRLWRPRMRRRSVTQGSGPATEAVVPQPRAGDHAEQATLALPTWDHGGRNLPMSAYARTKGGQG